MRVRPSKSPPEQRLGARPSTQEVLAGLVERVPFHNAENGFCVLRAKARGHRDRLGIEKTAMIRLRAYGPACPA